MSEVRIYVVDVTMKSRMEVKASSPESAKQMAEAIAIKGMGAVDKITSRVREKKRPRLKLFTRDWGPMPDDGPPL
mgnify:FL=1